MNTLELQQQTESAAAYEALFVPALFAEWGPRVAAAARIRPGDRVLDVACGTGALTREAARRASPGGTVTGLDINAGMLAVAAREAPQIRWKQGEAESLPFADGSFDAVVSEFGLMFFADRQRALREMMRVLVPGGRLAVAVWASLDDTPAYAAEVALLDELGEARAADALRAPFVLGDRDMFAALLAEAGVPSPTLATHTGQGRFPSIRTMVEADLRGWLPLVGAALEEEQIQTVLQRAELVLRPYRAADGSVRFDAPAHIASATKPEPDV